MNLFLASIVQEKLLLIGVLSSFYPKHLGSQPWDHKCQEDLSASVAMEEQHQSTAGHAARAVRAATHLQGQCC